MFLSLLNNREKQIFINLATSIIKAKGELGDSENKMLSDFAGEMQISLNEIIQEIDVKELLKELSENSTDQVKRIIYVELMAFINTDGDFDTTEKELFQTIVNTLGFNTVMISKCTELLNSYISAYISLTQFIEKGE